MGVIRNFGSRLDDFVEAHVVTDLMVYFGQD